MKTKFQRAKSMVQSFKKYEVLSKELITVQRRLDTRVLTPREAAEKARATVGAEEEFFDLAHEFYSFKLKPEDQENLRLIIGPETRARKPNLGFGEIEIGVVESDFSTALVYTDDDFDIAGIQRVSDVLTRTQSHIRYILEAEMTIEGSENRTNRKKKNFIEDLRDLISLLKENPIDDIQEVIIASEFLEKVKDLDEQFRENRNNMDDFKTEYDLGDDHGNFNIKERLLGIKR